jgi:hypothetical protein
MIQLSDSNVYNIVVVGGGATGSQLFPFLTQLLANLKGHLLKIVDGDIFEKKNSVNQKCTHLDENKAKAMVIGTRYKRVYPNINITYVESYIKDKKQLIKLLDKEISYNKNYIPVLIGCVDNNATRKIFNEVFEEMRSIIYIDSGNGTENRVGQTVVGYKKLVEVIKHSVNDDGKPVSYPEYHPKLILSPAATVFPDTLEDKETVDKALSCGAVVDEHPQNIATNVLAATNLFLTLTNILKFNKIQAHVSYFDADKQELISREAFYEEK